MNDRKDRGDPGRHDKWTWLWAWVYLGCVMLPCILYPGNLGPIAVVVCLIVYGSPAFVAGLILGNIFRSQSLINRLILTALGIGMSVYMFSSVVDIP